MSLPIKYSQKGSIKFRKFLAGFTLVELMVSVGIFAFMTSLMVAKYGNFNQSVLLTNLAYDVAVTIRTAQSYGLSVKGIGDSGGEDKFQSAYGVHFSSHGGAGNNDTFTLFVDSNGDGFYDPTEAIETYTLKRGAVIGELCASNNSDCDYDGDRELVILFKRPDPSAKISITDNEFGSTWLTNQSYAKITVYGSDASKREISVRENGQISVLE